MSPPRSPNAPFAALDGLSADGLFDVASDAGGGPAADVPTPSDLALLLPDYDIRGIVGRGGMGAVYHAVQKKLGRPVAIKLLPVSMGDTPGFAERFRREAMTTAGLAHPDIVTVHDSGETVAGHCYYVMDLVDGEDLARRMARGRLTVDGAITLLTAICSAVEAAHARNIVHRDIKPSNILLTPEGRPKLADFGLALLTEKHLEYSRLTLGGTTLGTLEYAAPEQLSGGRVTAASDQYSLGVLAYEMLTGELPRGVFEPPSARNPHLDPAFDGVILRALQSDPARRHASVADFREALVHAADRRAQTEARDREARKKLRRRTLLAAAAALVAFLTLGLAAYAWKQRHTAVTNQLEAQSQRDSARLTRAEAEKLVEFMLGELQGRLFEVNRLDVLEDVVKKVDAYYSSLPPGDPQDAAFQLRKAEFLELRGALAGKSGQRESALSFIGAAQSIRRTLVAAQPRNPTIVGLYIEGGVAEAEARSVLGDHMAAAAIYEDLLAKATVLHGDDPGENLHAIMPRTYTAFELQRAGQHGRAEALARDELDRIDRILKERGDSGDYGLHNARCTLLLILTEAAERRNDLPAAAELALARARTQLRWLPHERNGYREIMASNAALTAGARLHDARRLPEADEMATIATALADRLAADSPTAVEARQRADHAAALWRQIRDRRQLPADEATRTAAANRWLADFSSERDAEALAWQALTDRPDDPEAHFAWAMASEEKGKDIEATAGPQAATDHYASRIARLEPFLADPEKAAWWRLSASHTLNRLGSLAERTGEPAAAAAHYRRSLDLRRALSLRQPENAREARNAASSARHLCRVLVRQGSIDEAAAVLHSLFSDMKSLRRDPVTGWHLLLAETASPVIAALPPEKATRLAAEARDFLLNGGQNPPTEAENAVLSRLRPPPAAPPAAPAGSPSP